MGLTVAIQHLEVTSPPQGALEAATLPVLVAAANKGRLQPILGLRAATHLVRVAFSTALQQVSGEAA
jgi:hypothetical protein